MRAWFDVKDIPVRSHASASTHEQVRQAVDIVHGMVQQLEACRDPWSDLWAVFLSLSCWLSRPPCRRCEEERIHPQAIPDAISVPCFVVVALWRVVQEEGFDSRRIIVAGFSQGGALACVGSFPSCFPWLFGGH